MERTLLTHAEIAGDPCSCPDVTMTARPPRRLLFWHGRPACEATDSTPLQAVARSNDGICADMGFVVRAGELVARQNGLSNWRSFQPQSACVVNTAAAHKVCPVFKFF